MKKFKFKATNLITCCFNDYDVNYNVIESDDSEQILVGFPIKCGPDVSVRYIVDSNDNDITLMVFNIIAKIPCEKRLRVIQACNAINCKKRYIKLSLDPNGSVNMAYDLPLKTPDKNIGEICLEMFFRFVSILNDNYDLFMKALYTDEILDAQINTDLIEQMEIWKLQKLCEATDTANTMDDGENNEDDNVPPS